MRSLRVEPGTVARHAPDLAGHCQRCPDSFCRGNCDGGGSSSESTDVENTKNGDTENQNSDDAGNDASEDNVAADSTADDAEVESTAQPADDDANGEGTIALAAENESAHEISNGNELSSKLSDKDLRDGNGSATFKLVNDIEYSGEIRLEQTDDNPINITLDLNGHKIKCLNTDKPLFDIANGATLTIKDSAQANEMVSEGQQLTNQGQSLNPANYGKIAELIHGNDGIPSNLTYYVTESTPSGTGTTETLVKHDVDIEGAIVACNGNANLRLINLYNNNGKGSFNLVSGVITQKKGGRVSSLVYAENGSTVNMSGGYVCGASSSGAGAGIMVSNEKGSASTLNVTGGVIAGNSAPSGGGVYAKGSTVTITNGVISGNSTLDSVGFGGGIMAEYDGSVTVSGGYITNNKYANFCGHDGYGDHGGAGLAARNGTHVTISGGQITGNYSEEAGGGVYITDVDRHGASSREKMAWLNITGGTIAANVSNRSEGAGIRVGQMVDAMIEGASKTTPVYITNNSCMSRFDWGGGGIFVQGDSDTASNAGRLFVYNSYISSNEAGGYGGGVAVCPTGKTLVTNTDGTAIFGNTSAQIQQGANDYDPEKNRGNDGTPHLSAGGYEGLVHKKNQDTDAYNSSVFRENGHADFFIATEGHKTPIAAVIGKMLGGGDAKYKGSKELTQAITIPANGGVQVYNSIGLSSGVQAGDAAATAAQTAATTFITGNYSWNHGGGIMSNGDLYLGVPADTYVYPSLKLKATKALKMKNKQTEESIALAKDQFSFSVYRKDSDGATEPSWNDKTFNSGGCTLVGTAKNDADGNITFDLGEQFIDKTVEANKITYYLVENAGNDLDITYDPAVYKIVVTVRDNHTLLMKVPSRENPNSDVPLYVHNYTITSVSPGDSTNSLEKDDQGYYSINGPGGEKTFTNKYTPYTSTGTWTPKVTKVVKGGEMKEFTLEFANNADFKDATTVKTDPKGEILTAADGKKSQTRSFDEIEYKLDQLDKLKTDSTGRGASKTFTYYVREKGESSTYPHYKFDQSVYRFKVVATDNTKGRIDCAVTYMKGTVDSDGNWKADVDAEEQNLTDTSNPTFTNTYSTSLPLSGMSGVTLTYLAGAAVLCAAAAWMHIRRKANAKGGERRE